MYSTSVGTVINQIEIRKVETEAERQEMIYWLMSIVVAVVLTQTALLRTFLVSKPWIFAWSNVCDDRRKDKSQPGRKNIRHSHLIFTFWGKGDGIQRLTLTCPLILYYRCRPIVCAFTHTLYAYISDCALYKIYVLYNIGEGDNWCDLRRFNHARDSRWHLRDIDIVDRKSVV